MYAIHVTTWPVRRSNCVIRLAARCFPDGAYNGQAASVFGKLTVLLLESWRKRQSKSCASESEPLLSWEEVCTELQILP